MHSPHAVTSPHENKTNHRHQYWHCETAECEVITLINIGEVARTPEQTLAMLRFPLQSKHCASIALATVSASATRETSSLQRLKLSFDIAARCAVQTLVICGKRPWHSA